MKFYVIAIVFVLACLLIWQAHAWYSRIQKANPPEFPAVYDKRGVEVDSAAGPIPKILWTYWHDLNDMPDLVQRCLANWRRFVPDHEIRLLSQDTMLDWLPHKTLPLDFAQWSAARQSDWLRLNLLATHGGIWSDASNFFTRDLAWLHQAQEQGGWELAAYSIDLMTRDPKRPIVESWFLASPPQTRLMQDWCNEFETAMSMGVAAYLESLKNEGQYADSVQGILNPAYLLIHVCLSRLQLLHPERYRFGVWRAEDSAYAYHSRVRWMRRNVHARLGLCLAGERVPPMIKLRGADRERLIGYVDKKWVREGSVFDIYLKPVNATLPVSTI